jgi:hypothetical protein
MTMRSPRARDTTRSCALTESAADSLNAVPLSTAGMRSHRNAYSQDPRQVDPDVLTVHSPQEWSPEALERLEALLAVPMTPLLLLLRVGGPMAFVCGATARTSSCTSACRSASLIGLL